MLFSDVDGTLLDGRTPHETVRASWAAASRSVEVVLASSRTVEELVTLLDELGGDGDVIAENGCCIAVRAPQLAQALGALVEGVFAAGVHIHRAEHSVGRHQRK